jgi:hypothetical protein
MRSTQRSFITDVDSVKRHDIQPTGPVFDRPQWVWRIGDGPTTGADWNLRTVCVYPKGQPNYRAPVGVPLEAFTYADSIKPVDASFGITLRLRQISKTEWRLYCSNGGNTHWLWSYSDIPAWAEKSQ